MAATGPNRAMGGERFRILYALLTELSRANSLEDVYGAAVGSLLAGTAASRAAILMFDEDGVMRFQASRGLSAEYQAAVTGHTPWRQGETGARPFVVDDVQADESLAAYRDLFRREGIGALGFVPLESGAGVFGKFMLYYAEPHSAAPEDLEIAAAIAAHVALATQKKRAETAQVRSEKRLQAILDYSPAMVWQKDLQGRYEMVNRRWAELLHQPAGKVIGKTDLEIFPKGIAEHYRQNDRLVLTNGNPIAVEESALLDDGLHTYISVKFPLEEGGRVTGICGIATDITDRRHLEIARQRLAAIVESSEDAIIGQDLDGLITSWNGGAERMFGYAEQEVIGRTVSMLVVPGSRDEVPELLERIRRGEAVGQYETRRKTKDGRTIDVQLTVSPVRDAAGTIVGAARIVRDITERKRAEAERAELLEREKDARRTAELLNKVGPRLAAQLDSERLVARGDGHRHSAGGSGVRSLFASCRRQGRDILCGGGGEGAGGPAAAVPGLVYGHPAGWTAGAVDGHVRGCAVRRRDPALPHRRWRDRDAQLSGGTGDWPLGRSAGWTVLRTRRAGAVQRTA